jgi:hypothetical protein
MTTQDYSDFRIDSTLPRVWEEQHSFNDILYEWMGRAPWLAVSGAAHLLAFFVLSAFPWDAFKKPEPPTIFAHLPPPAEEPAEEPEEVLPEEPPVPEETLEDLEDPVLTDVLEDALSVDDLGLEEFEGDLYSLFAADSQTNTNEVIGVGSGGGKFGPRGGGLGNYGKGGGGTKMYETLEDALDWLKYHQAPDGSWDADGFSEMCGGIGSTICDGAGRAQHDVGVTGLAMLAFLSAGSTTSRGVYQEQVKMGTKWLKEMQDKDTGLIGDMSSHEFLYNHSIATLALCEVYYDSKSPLLARTCQDAVNYIQRARNPYGAWRYDVPPMGDQDTSMTGWMVFALKAAEDADLQVDRGAYEGAMSMIDEFTDEASGRVGYNALGNRSSRITGVNDHFPAEKGEAMTAVGLLCRIFMGQDDLKQYPMLKKHGDLMLRSLPKWDPDGFGNDMYYWYYGTYAMYQLGGKHWRLWEEALQETVLKNQRKDGDAKGSWDPNGPWGFAGGRVYSTAMLALSIEVYFRYPNITGAR